MEITYIGHSCFRIKGKNATIVVDPYDPEKVGYKLPKLEADILLISHQHADHNFKDGVKNYSLLADTPGEYESKGVFIQGFESFHDAEGGAQRGKNVVYYVEIDGFSFLHLGDLGHELGKETLEQLPGVDVIMIPVGGVYTIDAETASNVISSIEPSIVIPMHYQTADLTGLGSKLDGIEKFLDEMGGDDKVKPLDKLKLAGHLASEETEIVVLSPQH
ncbi:MBL fold metallo-hydrolase [candidate division WWE3 bacterium]|nr:MBL fold metallo-hydrolase [candidate division WWE3 bacterium]